MQTWDQVKIIANLVFELVELRLARLLPEFLSVPEEFRLVLRRRFAVGFLARPPALNLEYQLLRIPRLSTVRVQMLVATQAVNYLLRGLIPKPLLVPMFA